MSQEACDKHMSWAPVVEFLETCKANPNLLAGAPEIWHSELQDYFTRPELGKAGSPLVVVAKLTYKPEKFTDAFEGWKPVVAHAKSEESGVLTYSVGKDVEHENRLTLVEAYE